MKKTLLAMTLAASMISGCSMIGGADTVSYDELKKEGDALLLQSDTNGYKASTVAELEVARLVVNSAFLASKPAYDRYTEELLATPALGNYFAAVEAVESEEEKRKIYDELLPKNKKIVDDFNKSSISEEVMSGLADASIVVLKSSAAFLLLDTTSMLSDVEFSEMMGEKDNVSLTMEQISYMDSTIVSAYENHKIVSAFSSAE